MADTSVVFNIIAKDRASSTFRGVGSSVDGLLRKMSGLAAGVGIGLVASLGAAASAAVVFGVKSAAALEQSQIAFTNLLGSAEAAKTFLGELQKFAAATPFEFSDLTSASQKLLAMGFTAKQIIPTMTAIGDAVAGIGGGAPEIDRVVIALGQMRAKQKVTTEEMMQLTELGIPAFQILADKMNLTVPALQDMLSASGGVGASKLFQKGGLDALIDGLEHGTKSFKGFAGMMNQQSKTLSGLWSTFKDNVSAALVQAFTPALPLLKKILDFATQAIPVIQGKFREMATDFAPFVDFIRGSVIPALSSLWSWFSTKIMPIMLQVRRGALQILIEGFRYVQKAIKDNEPQLRQFGDFLKMVAEKLAPFMRMALVGVGIAVGTIVGSIVVLIGIISNAIDMWNKLWNLIHGPTKVLNRRESPVGPTKSVGRTAIPAFADGGIMPGPKGQPGLAILHGGERVTPPGQSGVAQSVDLNITVDIPEYGIKQKIRKIVRLDGGGNVQAAFGR